MKKCLLFAIIFTGCVFTLNAQTKSELQIGLAMPQGDFADDNEIHAIFDGSGVAGTGFYLGYKLLAPLNADGLYGTFNIGMMYNDLQSDFKDDLEEDLEEDNEDADFSLPKYLNVPVFAGLQYEKSLSDGLKLYGEAGVGLNVLKLTNLSLTEEDDYYDYELTYKFDPSVKLGYKIGAGIVIQDKYTIALNYMGLGSHKVKYEIREDDNGDVDKDHEKFDEKLPVRSLNITLGIRF